ncbi:F0F1 ATP synthase subunit A [Immundisolibacter sp.]|uniref:F0F1 ATP synthase subunit A n=1 Tax=Immundisolibacter sp. TaxID=1934948 RepID=UPI00262BCD00|nr:F0F1 ATP synthase subunit A [Immundisolibacter sp.]MDD3650091.1 F0F1 ATP synthase subunit A [Immundisolibacter sp.]
MDGNDLLALPALQLGPLRLSESLLGSLAVSLLLAALAALAGRRLRAAPGRWQTAVEGLVGAAEAAVRALVEDQAPRVLPFVATLWAFLLCANLVGLIPGLESPTRDLSVTAALAVLVFASVHWFGIRASGWRAYFRRYLQPSPLLLPFHLVSEFTRTLALAVRLFGNIMSLELTALLVLTVVGLLVPVPILLLHVIEAVVQAYIFGMLALVYIAGGLQAHER